MKKLFTVLTILLGLFHFTTFAQEAKIMLKHGEKVTMYDNNQLSNAISASEDGDTILLTVGEFKGDVTINKKISIIGAGQNSIINGNIYIKFNGEQTLSARVLDGLRMGDLYISSSLIDLSIRKVQMRNMEMQSGGKLRNALFDRCHFSNLLAGEDVVYGTVINSYVHQTYYAARNLCFVNCFIYLINGQSYASNNFAAACTNTIIRHQQYSLGISNSGVLRNCIIGGGIPCEGALKENCHILPYNQIDELDRTNTNDLVSKGYIGIDGTAIGEYGGLTPYSLEPSGPKITSIQVKVDPTSNTLKVSATGKVN